MFGRTCSAVRVRPRACSAAYVFGRYVFSRTCSAVRVQSRTCSAAYVFGRVRVQPLRVRPYVFSRTCSAVPVRPCTCSAAHYTTLQYTKLHNTAPRKIGTRGAIWDTNMCPGPPKVTPPSAKWQTSGRAAGEGPPLCSENEPFSKINASFSLQNGSDYISYIYIYI